MHYVWMLVVGVVIGALARLVLPGAQHMGIIMTGILGIVGSFVGGFVVRLLSRSTPAEVAKIQPAGIVMSVIGAVLVLVVCTKLFV